MATKAPAPEPVVVYGDDTWTIGTFVQDIFGRDVDLVRTVRSVTIDGDSFAQVIGKKTGKPGRLVDLCGRCGGRGRMTEYAGVMGGICFQCHGPGIQKVFGTVEEAVATAVKRAKGRAARERAKARKAERDKAAFVEWAVDHEPLVAALRPIGEAVIANGDGIDYAGPLIDFGCQIYRADKPLSDKQVVFAEKLLAEHAEQAAAQADAAAKVAQQRYAGEPGGKVTVTGTVAAAIYIEPKSYGWSASTLLIVEGIGDDAGVTVKWFTTAGIDCGKGDAVTITGTVKAHDVYEEVKQTVMTRCKVQVIAAAE